MRIHASVALIGESAVLVRGATGSGKTQLCLDLIAAAEARSLFARLVCDDRVELGARHGRLVASALPGIAGMVERRGLGLVPVPHESLACVRLVVDLVQHAVPRLPDPADLVTVLAGITLPRLASEAGRTDPRQVLAALALFNDEPWEWARVRAAAG